MFYISYYNSPIGKLLLAERYERLAGLWIEGQRYFAESINEETTEKETILLYRAKKWLDDYFEGKRPLISELPLAPEGSDLRHCIWKLLCEIPYGETTTYGALAEKGAKITGRAEISPRAVGGAVGHNRISIIIPCHRVVGANGSLTGYAGGITAKIKLLKHEGVRVDDSAITKIFGLKK